MIDNTITPEATENIFLEIVNSFPTMMTKKEFGQFLLRVCSTAYKKNKPTLFLLPECQIINIKTEKLSQAIGIYNSELKLLTLN